MFRDRIPVGGEIFRTCPDRPWGPPSLLYNGYGVFPGGKERPGRDADPSPPSSAIARERVDLYLYSPYGPYGLYRASVPVQGCILSLPFTCFGRLWVHHQEMSVSYAGCIPDGHPHRITSTKRRINTLVSPDDGHIVARNM